jgi:formate hydrogenlyase subunit 3/multisubunit Na+/H+ antiporter MnhD subunit
MNSLMIITPLVFLSLLFIVLSHKNTILKYKVIYKIIGYSILAIIIILLYIEQFIDIVSLILASSFTIFSLIISTYTLTYMKTLHYPNILEILVDAFLYALIATYTAPNIVILVSTWTLVEILGFMLIKTGEEHSLEGPLTSSRGFLLTSTATYELSVFTFITVSLLALGNLGPNLLLKTFTESISKIQASYIILPLLLVGFLTKAAITPLHFWLPSAHSTAPSPASAALSGFTVSLGYYGLYRVLNYIEISDFSQYLGVALITLGGFSIIYGGVEALSQRDVKRLLAYSTVMTDGFILVLFALYLMTRTQQTLILTLTGILTQAAYKTTLFCEAGLFEMLHETRYMHLIRGVIRSLPVSSLGGLLAVSSLIGVPGTLGFATKIASIYVAFEELSANLDILISVLVAFTLYIALSAVIGVKYVTLYYTPPTKPPLIVRKITRWQQLPVLLLGLTNITLTPLYFHVLGYTWLTLLTVILAPIPIITVYLVAYTASISLKRSEGVSTWSSQ